MGHTASKFLDEPPDSETLTTYDREHIKLYMRLLDAERERLAAEDAQAAAEVELYSGIVAIYKALGGGWQPQA